MKGIEQFVQVDAATLGALKYAGTWNASTNTPTLASGVGVQGQYYVVSVAGSTNLDGVTNWGVGDWAVFNGTVWQRVEGGADGNFVNLSVTGTATISGTAEFADGLAASPSITNIGDTNTGMYFPSADAIGIVTGGVNRIRITSAGDVGIGTTTPALKLDVANGFVIVGANSANPGVGGNVRLRDDTGAARWLSGLLGGAGATAYSIYDIVAGAERLNISSTGDVGIGTSNPGAPLTVYKGAAGADVAYLLNGSGFGLRIQPQTGGGGTNTLAYVSSGESLSLGTNNTERMRITSTGNVGIGTSSPSSAYSGATLVAMVAATGTTAASLRVSSANASAELYSAGSVTEWGLYSASNSPFSIWTNNNKNLTLDSSGNLGLGVTPSAWGAPAGIDIGAFAGFGQRSDNGWAVSAHNCYFDGTNWKYKATGIAPAYYGVGSGLHYWFTAPSGTAGNTISFTQAMTLDASGNLGVGTTTGVASGTGVAIYSPTASRLQLRNSTTGDTASDGCGLLAFGSDLYVENRENGATLFFNNGSERARIDSSGNLLVGKTTASGTTVGPELLANGQINAATANLDNLNIYNTTAAAYRFYVNAAGTVFATNTTISAISDQRLKENVQDLDAGLDKIMALKPRKFDWKPGKGKDIKGDRGFIAQEFEQVFPDLIDEWKDQDEGEDPYKSVRQDLIPVLVKAIQELKAEVDSLKAQLGA